MSDRHEDVDARLTLLREATGAVAPRSDFAARVAAAVARDGEASTWLRDLVRPARRLVPIAAVAAALVVAWAAHHARPSDGADVAINGAELDTEW